MLYRNRLTDLFLGFSVHLPPLLLSEVALNRTQVVFPIHRISWFYLTGSFPFPISLLSGVIQLSLSLITMASMIAREQECPFSLLSRLSDLS